MAATRKSQGNTAACRSSRPNLTIDTRAPPKPGVDLSSTQSAPVGTRQEKGIPPMYQSVDRYCAKVSEMMNTPTWRSQRPGPAVADDSTPQSPVAKHDYGRGSHGLDYQQEISKYHRHENEIDGAKILSHDGWRPHKSQHFTDEAHWARDGEAMSVLHIQPFPETPEAPESSADTFIISATVCQQPNSPVNTVIGEMQPFRVPKRRTRVHSKIARDGSFSENYWEDDSLRVHEESTQSSPRPVQQNNEEKYLRKEDAVKDKVRDICELMERDEAIESVNFEHVSPRVRRPATPEEERRFRDLLSRLQPRTAGQQKKNQALADPAIISFAPKNNNDGSGCGNLMAQLRAAGEQYMAKSRHNSSSDSGYTSLTTHSKPSTRPQSRVRQDTSIGAGSETPSTQHPKRGSKDSGYGSPSKQSTLNPTAKEFSSADVAGGSPTKQGWLSRPPLPDNIYLTAQLQDTMVTVAPGTLSAAVQSPGPIFNGMPTHITVPLNFFDSPGLTQASPGLVPQMNPLINPILQPQSGFGLPGAFTSMWGELGPVPCQAPPPGPGNAGMVPPPGLVSTPGLAKSGVAGPFHHQLPNTASCNNPAHQCISPFNSAHVSPVSSMTPLPPPAPPASLLPHRTNALVSPPTAPAAPMATPFIRKSVPKPKVPNTTGQQYWEYVHEMRRMYEPGYAQKSKTNQQKRFLKQLHKNVDTTGQS
ncbi:hypothetical protein VPNG_06933 [Cytospora leucostoma]|uniref:Uncharacterized protein n=1 Tax=Cytospora leucostoma TaxID=1230097 RepID=A0A423WXC5_9PEZI|nr:hypothetical protein VPNG_06933 [Cytospora leucostoma]